MARNSWDAISRIPAHIDRDYRRHNQAQVDEFGRSRASERTTAAKQALANAVRQAGDEAAKKAAISELVQLGLAEVDAGQSVGRLQNRAKKVNYGADTPQQEIIDALTGNGANLKGIKYGKQTLDELEAGYAANAIDNAPWWDPAANLARTQRAMAADDTGGVIARYGIPTGATLGTIAIIDAMARLGDPAAIAVVEQMPEE